MKFIVFIVLSLYYSYCEESDVSGEWFYLPSALHGEDENDKVVVVVDANVDEEGGDDKDFEVGDKDESAEENEKLNTLVGEDDEKAEDDKDLDEKTLDATEEEDPVVAIVVDDDEEDKDANLLLFIIYRVTDYAEAYIVIVKTYIDYEPMVDDIGWNSLYKLWNALVGEDNEKAEDDKDLDDKTLDATEEEDPVVAIVVADDEEEKGHLDGDESEGDEKYNISPTKDITQLFGTNQHYNIPANYQDLGRRFVLQYPYKKKKTVDEQAEEDLHKMVQHYMEEKQNAKKLVPIKAPPEFVLKIAKQSAILEKSKPKNPSDDFIEKDILRTKDYWNDVWVEEVNPKTLLRSSHTKYQPESLKVLIQPGSKLYNLVSSLKEESPRLVYVINKSDE